MSLDRKRKRENNVTGASVKRSLISPRAHNVNQDRERYTSEHYESDGSPSVLPPLGGEEDEASSNDGDAEEWSGIGHENVEGKNLKPGVEGWSSSYRPNKPPTALELRDIKEATDLYKSSSFKLQIDALLPNVRPKYQRSAPLDKFLRSLYSLLDSIESVPPQHPLVASREMLKKHIAVSYPHPPPTEDTNWKVSFEKPTEILLVGSWPNKLSVKAKDKERYGVDLAVEMPADLFQEKDYLNSRFFHKRAYYLSVIAAAVTDKTRGLNVDISYASPGGDPRLTCLVLRPKPEQNQTDFTKLNVEVRIIPMLSTSSPINIQRLSPRRSNIRASSSSEDTPHETPTPLYNNAIMFTTTPRACLLRVHELKEKIPAFGDALTLLRVWANQRGYAHGRRMCVRGFEDKGPWWAAVLDLLITGQENLGGVFAKSGDVRKPLGKGLSSYQLFRAALDFLARHDFSREPVFIKSEKGHRFMPEEYESSLPVFVDSTSTNLLAGVSIGSLEMLKYDAKLTLDTLNENLLSGDPFNEIFLKEQRELPTRFDLIVRVDLSQAKLRAPSLHATLDCGSPYNALIDTLVSNLRIALSNRAKAVTVLHPSSQPWSISQAHPPNPSIIFIGIILNVEQAFRLVDHGPTADNPDPKEAQRFRELWGDKAELRRFKDGSIVESVVWDVKTSNERAHIPFFICQHILGQHCGIPKEDVQHWQAAYDSLLRLPESITSTYQTVKAEVGFKAALAAFDKLVKGIKALDDQLPLSILNVSPVSESLRYTNVFAPTSLTAATSSLLPRCARYLQSMEIIVEFEKSGRWPDDLRAIQKIKLAFFERLAAVLMESTPGLKATVVVGENTPTSDMQDVAALEIITPQGWAFIARIWHDREATLLDNLIDDKPHIPTHLKRKLEVQSSDGTDAKERRAALEAREIYTRRFVHAPRHHRAIAALNHRFPAYAGTVRLVKRWLASHWVLEGHVSAETVELICASVFLQSAEVPGTKERGFAKAVELLKDWEWEKGLFVPLYGEEQSTKDSAAATVTSTVGTGGAWAVSTEFDREGHMWTSKGPDAIIARRIRAIAKATWEASQKIESGGFDVKTLFTHPTDDYDFIVDLNSAVLPRYCQNVKADPVVWSKKGKYANALPTNSEAESNQADQLGFDPAQLLYNDLSRIYKDTFKIFYDALGGDRYGAVWEPSLKNPRPFRILGGFNSTPLRKGDASGNEKEKDKEQVVLNSQAVLKELERIGSGLIKGITEQV